MTNLLPSSVGSWYILPLCSSSIIFLHIASPRPVPLTFVVKMVQIIYPSFLYRWVFLHSKKKQLPCLTLSLTRRVFFHYLVWLRLRFVVGLLSPVYSRILSRNRYFFCVFSNEKSMFLSFIFSSMSM